MAENHPVGFQWVIEAKRARRDGHPRRPALHAHERDRRHARPDPRGQRHRLPRRRSSTTSCRTSATSASTSCPTRTRPRSCRRTTRTPRTSTGCSAAGTPRARPTTRPPGSTRAWRSTPPPATARWARSTASRPTAPTARGMGDPEAAQRDETLQDPRCVYQVLRRHFARYTPAMVAADLRRRPQDKFLAIVRGPVRELRAASAPARSATPSAGRSTPIGAQNIRTAAILQLLLGNIGRPGGGIMALRGHASIQGSTDIPTLYNLLPGYLPMPSVRDDDTSTATCERNTPPAGFWSIDARLHRLAAEGVVRRRGDGGERLLLRPPPAHDRRPLRLPDAAGHGGRRRRGLLRHGREPDGRRGQRPPEPQRAGRA